MSDILKGLYDSDDEIEDLIKQYKEKSNEIMDMVQNRIRWMTETEKLLNTKVIILSRSGNKRSGILDWMDDKFLCITDADGNVIYPISGIDWIKQI